jgi:glutamate/tyrosine decarboxylase-like PLP-dependent enzyme
VERRPDFEPLSESVLSIANFRYRPKDRSLSEEDLDRANRKIANRLLGGGSFFLAPTVLKGRTALRVCVVNFRTRREDLTYLLDETARLGREIVEATSFRPPSRA